MVTHFGFSGFLKRGVYINLWELNRSKVLQCHLCSVLNFLISTSFLVIGIGKFKLSLHAYKNILADVKRVISFQEYAKQIDKREDLAVSWIPTRLCAVCL